MHVVIFSIHFSDNSLHNHWNKGAFHGNGMREKTAMQKMYTLSLWILWSWGKCLRSNKNEPEILLKHQLGNYGNRFNNQREQIFWNVSSSIECAFYFSAPVVESSFCSIHFAFKMMKTMFQESIMNEQQRMNLFLSCSLFLFDYLLFFAEKSANRTLNNIFIFMCILFPILFHLLCIWISRIFSKESIMRKRKCSPIETQKVTSRNGSFTKGSSLMTSDFFHIVQLLKPSRQFLYFIRVESQRERTETSWTTWKFEKLFSTESKHWSRLKWIFSTQ